VSRLTLYYDGRCGLCCALRDWIDRQRQLVPIDCRPKADAKEELVVVADTGEIWSGDGAWLMVLWALADYRRWSYRLATPTLLPMARAVFAQISEYRGAISCGLGFAPTTR